MGLDLLHFASLLTLIISVNSAETSKGQPAYNGVAYANFKAHYQSYLNITSIATELVQNEAHCAFACVNTRSCFSFNLARNKTSMRLCELLPSDKYINSDKFIAIHLNYDHFAIPSPCSREPCRKNEICVPVYETDSFNCEKNCQREYRLVFPEPRSADGYAMKQPAIESDLSELSVCFFAKIVQDGQEHTVFSYANQTTNDLIITFFHQISSFWVDNTPMFFNLTANSTWHHFCFTWENTNGTYKAYKDGKLEDQGADFLKGYIVRAGGIVVLGQDQDSFGGGFSTNDAFVGELTEVNMWDRVLSEGDIAAQFENCSIPHGSVLAWPVFKDVVYGQVKVVEP